MKQKNEEVNLATTSAKGSVKEFLPTVSHTRSEKTSDKTVKSAKFSLPQAPVVVRSVHAEAIRQIFMQAGQERLLDRYLEYRRQQRQGDLESIRRRIVEINNQVDAVRERRYVILSGLEINRDRSVNNLEVHTDMINRWCSNPIVSLQNRNFLYVRNFGYNHWDITQPDGTLIPTSGIDNACGCFTVLKILANSGLTEEDLGDLLSRLHYPENLNLLEKEKLTDEEKAEIKRKLLSREFYSNHTQGINSSLARKFIAALVIFSQSLQGNDVSRERINRILKKGREASDGRLAHEDIDWALRALSPSVLCLNMSDLQAVAESVDQAFYYKHYLERLAGISGNEDSPRLRNHREELQDLQTFFSQEGVNEESRIQIINELTSYQAGISEVRALQSEITLSQDQKGIAANQSNPQKERQKRGTTISGSSAVVHTDSNSLLVEIHSQKSETLRLISLFSPLLQNQIDQKDILDLKQQENLDNLAEKLRAKFQDFLKSDDKDHASSDTIDPMRLFVPPLASYQAKEQGYGEYDCIQGVRQFLGDTQKKSLLILGDAGQGKTLLMQMLALSLWEDYAAARKLGKIGVLPIYIHLARIPSIDLQQKLLRSFLEENGLDAKEINLLQTHQPVLLLLDGYDEIRENQNFYRSNGWSSWKDLRMITTCRPEKFSAEANYIQYFCLTNKHQELIALSLMEIQLSLFKEAQIKQYVEQYISYRFPIENGFIPTQLLLARQESREIEPSDWRKSVTYLYYLKAIPNLMALVETPVVLSMVIPILPSILETARIYTQKELAKQDLPGESSFSEAMVITRAQLYDVFTKNWFEREKPFFLKQMESLRVRLQNENDVLGYMECYAKNLAYQALKQGKLDIIFSDEDTLNPELLRPNNTEHELHYEEDKGKFEQRDVMFAFRRACLLKVSRTEFTFMNKSLVEYFTSKELFQSILSAAEFYTTKLAKNVDASNQSLLENCSKFNTQLLVEEPQILKFLSDHAKEHASFHAMLWDLVEFSKTEPRACIAAANAISVLNINHEIFSMRDLKGIRIPGADLSGSVCEGTQFQGSDLRRVRFHNAWLSKADFTEAILQDVKFGGAIILNGTINVTCSAYSTDNKFLAVGDSLGYVKLYKMSTYTQVTMENWSYWVTGRRNNRTNTLVFSSDNSQLIVGSEDGYIRFWEIPKGSCMKEIQACKETIEKKDSLLKGVVKVAFHPSEDQIAYLDENGVIGLVDSKKRKIFHTLPGSYFHFEYNPKGSQMLLLSTNGERYLYDIETKNQERILDREEALYAVVYHPNGRQLISTWSDSKIGILEIDTKELVLFCQNDLGQLLLIASYPDGKNFLFIDKKTGGVFSYDLEKNFFSELFNENSQKENTNNFCCLSLRGDGQQIALSTDLNKPMCLLDTSNKSQNKVFLKNKRDNLKGSKVLKHPLEKKLIFLNSGGVDILNSETGLKTATIQKEFLKKILYTDNGLYLIGHFVFENSSSILELCFSSFEISVDKGIYNLICRPDSKQLAWISAGCINLFDIETKYSHYFLKETNSGVISFIYSPDSQQLAFLKKEHIYLSNIETGTQIRIFNIDPAETYVFSYSPDCSQFSFGADSPYLKMSKNSAVLSGIGGSFKTAGGVLLVIGGIGIIVLTFTAKVIEIMDGKPPSTSTNSVNEFKNALDGGAQMISTGAHVAVENSGIAFQSFRRAGSRNWVVSMVNLKESKELKLYNNQNNQVNSLVYHPNSQQISSSSNDEQTTRLWNSTTAVLAHTLEGKLLSYSTDGTYIATCISRVIYLWNTAEGSCFQKVYFPMEINQFIWGLQSDWFYVGVNSGARYGYQCVEEFGKFILKWATRWEWSLTLSESIVEQSVGLSMENQALLKQYGSNGTPKNIDIYVPPDPATLISESTKQKKLIQFDMHLVTPGKAIIKYQKSIPSQACYWCTSATKPNHNLTYDYWVVSLMRKPDGKLPNHVFILIEGLDAYGRGILMRYDMFQFKESEKSHLAYIDVKIKMDISVDQLEAVFHSEKIHIQGEKFYACIWALSRPKVIQLYQSLQKDVYDENGNRREHPYKISGNKSLIGSVDVNSDAHNCFTWARKKLLEINDKNINKDLKEKFIDKIIAHPAQYIYEPKKEMGSVDRKQCITM